MQAASHRMSQVAVTNDRDVVQLDVLWMTVTSLKYSTSKPPSSTLVFCWTHFPSLLLIVPSLISIHYLTTRKQLRAARDQQVFRTVLAPPSRFSGKEWSRHLHTSTFDASGPLYLHRYHYRAHPRVNTEHPIQQMYIPAPSSRPYARLSLTLVTTHTTLLPTRPHYPHLFKGVRPKSSNLSIAEIHCRVWYRKSSRTTPSSANSSEGYSTEHNVRIVQGPRRLLHVVKLPTLLM